MICHFSHFQFTLGFSKNTKTIWPNFSLSLALAKKNEKDSYLYENLLQLAFVECDEQYFLNVSGIISIHTIEFFVLQILSS